MEYARTTWRVVLLTALLMGLQLATGALPVDAQGRTATLTITVLDQTNAVIPGATVTVVGTDATTRGKSIEPAKTAPDGTASVAGLPPGVYSVKAEFPGFETRLVPQVRVRPGGNMQVVLLPIAAVTAAVTVEQNKQEAAADPHGPSFGTTLTREQLDALSDDPDVLRQQLQDMAGPGAVIKVDSFEGAALPPKAQIRSIRIPATSLPPRTTAPAASPWRSSRSRGLAPCGTRRDFGSVTARSAAAVRSLPPRRPSRSRTIRWA